VAKKPLKGQNPKVSARLVTALERRLTDELRAKEALHKGRRNPQACQQMRTWTVGQNGICALRVASPQTAGCNLHRNTGEGAVRDRQSMHVVVRCAKTGLARFFQSMKLPSMTQC
jgi:hypothetical protein